VKRFFVTGKDLFFSQKLNLVEFGSVLIYNLSSQKMGIINVFCFVCIFGVSEHENF